MAKSINSRIQAAVLRHAVPSAGSCSLPCIRAARVAWDGRKDHYHVLATNNLDFATVTGAGHTGLISAAIDAKSAIDMMGSDFSGVDEGRLVSDAMTVPAMDLEKLPELAECYQDCAAGASVTVGILEVQEMLPYLKSAMSTDLTRIALCALHVKGKVWEATDGHRLHRWNGRESAGSTELETMIPAGVVNLLCKLPKAKLGYITLFARAVAVNLGDADPLFIYWREVEGPFPNCEQVIPKDRHGSDDTILEVEPLVDALKACKAVVGKLPAAQIAVRNGTPGELTLSANDKNGATCERSIAYDGAFLAPFGVNVHYLLDALKVVDDRVRINSSGGTAPMTVRADKILPEYNALVMPLRLAD